MVSVLFTTLSLYLERSRYFIISGLVNEWHQASDAVCLSSRHAFRGGGSSVYRCCGVLNNWLLSPYGKRQKSLVVKYVHSDSQTLRVQIPALPLVTCVPSSKLLSLSLTWFLLCQIGIYQYLPMRAN